MPTIGKAIRSLAVGLACAGLAGGTYAGIYDDLLRAIEGNNMEEVTSILQRGMDVNTVDMSGNSLLMLAVMKGNA